MRTDDLICAFDLLLFVFGIRQLLSSSVSTSLATQIKPQRHYSMGKLPLQHEEQRPTVRLFYTSHLEIVL